MAFAVHLDVAVMGLDRGLGDRQADACAAMLAVSRAIHPVEPIEQPRKMFWCDAVATIAYDYREFVGAMRSRHADETACARVA
jgi:hypothetical protein